MLYFIQYSSLNNVTRYTKVCLLWGLGLVLVGGMLNSLDVDHIPGFN